MKPVSKKGEVRSPSLLKQPPLSRNPDCIQGTQPESIKLNRMSYFDIKEPSIASPNRTDTMEQGLGINFYEEEASGGQQHEGDVEAEILAATRPRNGVEAQAFAQPQSMGQSPSFSYEPFEIPDDPPLSLIEKLLEENYRGQAETFVRNSSQASVHSLSLTRTSSQSSSTAASIGNKGPFERSPSIYTPTRKPTKSENLGSDLSIQIPHSLRTPNGASRVVIEPYRIQSGSNRKNNRSGFSPESAPPPIHTTYGHRVFTVPRLPNNRLSIPKRGKRSSAQIRGPLYFTSQERQAIAELVHANPRDCDRHTNCTDCHNLEYAYFENKAMPTSIPPEERQKIINSNRSLRNIKNVRIFTSFPMVVLTSHRSLRTSQRAGQSAMQPTIP